jgi:transposase
MVLLSSQGRNIKEICSIVYRSENTVSTWLKAYEDKGFLGLYDEPIPGRPSTLNQDQKEQIGTWLDDSPRKEGYQQSNWTLKLVNHHVLQEFGQRFSLSRIWEIVHGQGFTLIRPRHKTIVPTQEEIEQTNNKTFHYLEKARLGEIRLFYLDETTATMWSTLSYVWARKGTHPEIPMADDHGRVYVFSAADPLRGKVHYRIAPTPHKEDMVAFLKQMRSRYPFDKLVFRLDNYPSHKAHIVTQFAEEDGNMQLEHISRYTSFKCNPIERLFKWFRRVVTHNQFFESITHLKSAIRAFFRSVMNQPKKVVSLLRLNLNSFPKILLC